jgi:hypothetical protein
MSDVLESLMEIKTEAKRPKCPSKSRDRDILGKKDKCVLGFREM